MRFKPQPRAFIERLGIAKNTAGSVSFKEIIASPKTVDNIFSGYEYTVYPPRFIDSRFKDKASSKAISDLKESLSAIASEANEKREKLRALLVKNPYLCSSVTWPYYVGKLLGFCTWTFTAEHPYCMNSETIYYSWFAILFITLGLPAHLTVWPYYLLVFCSYLLGFLMDLITLKVFSRFGAKEVVWINHILQNNKELDGDAVDNAVSKSVEELLQRLNPSFENILMEYWKGVEIIAQGEESTVDMDEFMILFSIQNQSTSV